MPALSPSPARECGRSVKHARAKNTTATPRVAGVASLAW